MRQGTHNFAFFSDLHLGRGEGEESAARALVTGIRERLDSHTTMIFLAGDCTENGNISEIETLLELVEQLEAERVADDGSAVPGFRVAVVPGNHDVSVRGVMGVNARRRLRFLTRVVSSPSHVQGGQDHVFYVDHGDTRVFLIDSTQDLEDNNPFDLARGRVGARAWRRVVALAESWGGPVGLVLHHHPTYREHILTNDNALLDADALREVVEQLEPVFVVCGHRHVHERLSLVGARAALACGKGTSLVTTETGTGYLGWWIERDGEYQVETPLLI